MDVRHRAIKVITLTLGIIAIGLIILFLKLNDIIELRCYIKDYTGYNCPGCGGTRMVMSLLKLDILQAFRWNPLLFIMIPFLAIIYIYSCCYYIKHGYIEEKVATILVYVAGILIVYGIVRNIPLFDWLAPTRIR